MADINLKAGNNIQLRQDDNDLYIDGADQTPMNVELIAISDTAPTSCVENDKYYNTEDNLVYTATDTDTWSEDGEEPIKDIFYILISNLKLYMYDGETLIEVSGSEPVPSNVELLAVTDTAPSECNEGDKYFNTSTKKIYTATGEDTWGSEGIDPILDIFYIVLSEQKIYTYDGTTLISVGGGSGGGTKEIEISDTEPTDPDVKLWIDTGEVESIGSEIHIGTEIDNRVRTNIIKSKNLFDKNNANIISGAYVANNVNVITSSGAGLKLLYIPITGGKTYTISKVSSNVFRVTTTTQIPAIGVSIASTTVNNSATSITYTTDTDAKYLVVNYYANADTLTEQVILDSIQIEEGSTATTYESFNSTKINIDGKDIYNEGLSVYSTNEQIIGTWIDGKSLYRKVIQDTMPTTTDGTMAKKDVDISSLNYDFIYLRNAFCFGISSGTKFNLPLNMQRFDDLSKVMIASIYGNSIELRTNKASYGGLSIYIILEYTKTTD